MNAQELANKILNTPLINEQDTLKQATRGVVDYFASSLQAKNQFELQQFKDWIMLEGGNKKAWLIGQKQLVTARQAALFNGFQAHYLDYDDVHATVRGHPSSVILSALFASIDKSIQRIDSRRFLTAYVIGVEVMARLGQILNPKLYIRGWHSTITLGGIAATCAIGYLHQYLFLSDAISLAATQSSGMRFVFGSPIKALHAGIAAQNAIQSIDWIKTGLSLPQNPFDKKIGFFMLFGDQCSVEDWGYDWEKNWQIHQLWFKNYPYCSAAAGIADISYKLRNKISNISDILQIEICFYVNSDAALIYQKVDIASQGKFSAEYILASILLNKKLDFQHFEQSQVEPCICQIMSKIHRTYQNNEVNPKKVKIRVQLKNGAILEAISNFPKGSPMNPYSNTQLKEKLELAIGNNSLSQQLYQDISNLKNGINIQDFIQAYQSIL